MKANSEIKNAALQELRGNWTAPVLAYLVYLVISAASGFPKIGALISLLLVTPLGMSFSMAMLQFVRGDKENVISNMFGEFRNYGRVLGVSLLVFLYTFLWSLLLIVPGIIKALSYAMTYFIAKDHPELSADECIERSKVMMDGHKADLFLLYLSFIGWFFLCILSLGIGFLWLSPYMIASLCQFYENRKAETEPETVAEGAEEF